MYKLFFHIHLLLQKKRYYRTFFYLNIQFYDLTCTRLFFHTKILLYFMNFLLSAPIILLYIQSQSDNRAFTVILKFWLLGESILLVHLRY